MPRSGSGSSKRKDRYEARTKGRVDDHRRRWLVTDSHTVLHYEIPEGEGTGAEGSQEGWGPTHVLTLVSNGIKRTMSVSLSDMTPEELNEFQKFVNLVIDRARPVTELREIKAKEAFDEGDDSYYRLYRPLPRYVDRTGQGSEHDKGDEE